MKHISNFQHENVLGFRFGSSPIGTPKMFSHIYFVDGLLIDTGHSNMSKEIESTVSDLSVEKIFITHHHEDHTGNLTQLQKRFNSPTYASPDCIEIMKDPPAISLAQWLIWGKSMPNTNIEPIKDSIATENYTFDLIPIPGHAPDMVCLYLKEKGWLFSADLWVSEYIRYFMRTESMKEQIESIGRILELDFDVMFCGHNPQFKDGKQKLRNKLQFLEDFYGQVTALHEQGNSPNLILSKMGLKEKWGTRILSTGALSTLNMIKSVIRDEAKLK